MSSRPVPGGFVAAAALIATLAGVVLWLNMLVGPWRLVSGLLDARRHLNRTQTSLSAGTIQRARYEVFAGVAAAERAGNAFDAQGPLFDIARAVGFVDDALGETDHLVAAAELSAEAASGTLDVADNALSGP